jgi:hypothetical protein
MLAIGQATWTTPESLATICAKAHGGDIDGE